MWTLVNVCTFSEGTTTKFIQLRSTVFVLPQVDWIQPFGFGTLKPGKYQTLATFVIWFLNCFFRRDCVALLQGHTALVCQLQLSPTILATGGSDGRVITFDLSKYTVLHRIAAHDSSVTSLQFDKNFLVTGGNDGRVRLYETCTGNYIRDLSDPSDTVWKVAYLKGACAIMCRRAGKTVVEIWSMKPKDS